MKIRSSLCCMALLVASLSSCTKDNYDAPESELRGRITYQGEALNLRGTDEKIRLQLYQDGYEKHDPIDVFVGQDGSFSAKLFDGQYKMVTRNGNGPWVNTRDTTLIELSGNQTMELEVTPFYLVSNTTIALAGSQLSTSFTIHQVVPTAKVERIIVLLNRTQFVDDGSNIFRQDDNSTPDAVGAVSYDIDLNGNAEVSNAKTLFARVCVWAKGADQGIYSPVIRLR